MSSETKSLKRSEAATLRLRNLYEKYGYRKYRMGSFEEYGLYAANKSFLPSEHMLTFTDLDGRLMALRPDVTLGIAKNIKIEDHACEKVYYIENVYRESKESHTYKEISQMGLECMGTIDDFVIVEVVSLAVRTLAGFGVDYVLKISNMDFVVGLMEELGLDPGMREQMLSRIRKKNRSELELLCDKAGLTGPEKEKMLKVPFLYGDFMTILEEAEAIADTSAAGAPLRQLREIYGILESKGLSDQVRLDLSMINDLEYYNGVIFQGYLEGLSGHVLSGGQYDGVMTKLNKNAGAIGFALYLKELDWLPEAAEPFDADVLLLYGDGVDFKKLCKAAECLRREGMRVRVDRSVPGEMHFRYIYRFDEVLKLLRDHSAEKNFEGKDAPGEESAGEPSGMLNIALPKGRLGDQVYELLASVGYDCRDIYEENRKLVFESRERGVRYLLVKPSDVALYVEHHAADVGIVGKDTLLEGEPDVYELLDLGLGRCRMCVAAKEDFVENRDRSLRVATKFPNVAKAYYGGKNREIDIIKLNGSIELAPILGLSDVIVDIVQSGNTLRENQLRVLEEFLPISARFIANKNSFEFKNDPINRMVKRLAEAVARQGQDAEVKGEEHRGGEPPRDAAPGEERMG